MSNQTFPLYSITTRQSFLGALMINVYHYRESPNFEEFTLAELVDVFAADVLPFINAVQSSQVENLSIRAYSFDDDTEHERDISGTNGIRPGDPLNSFSAWGFKLIRNNLSTRNGSKRIGGIAESDVSGNLPEQAIEGELFELATALHADLEPGGDGKVSAFIYRRDSWVDGDWIGNGVNDAAFKRVTSQVSRKVLLA